MRRDVYYGRLKLQGEEHPETLLAANNYAANLVVLERFEAAKSLFRKTIPVVRRVLGDSNSLTLQMRANYAQSLYKDATAALDDLREAVTTVEETERIARRVLGGAHPVAIGIARSLKHSRDVLRAREKLQDARATLSARLSARETPSSAQDDKLIEYKNHT